jgi:hypothetical protein
MLIKKSSNLSIFKRFMGHDMAPMASGIPDGKKNRLIFLFSFLESLISPRIPVYRILCVLKEIRTFVMY